MSRVLESQSVEKYLEKIQKLKVLSTNDPEKLEKLLDFVIEQKLSFGESPEINFLFKGEHAFHNGNYEQALINYMQARAIPSFEFFCYRATAYVSFLRGDNDKAISFILKALGFRPLDYDTLKLYHEILTQKGEREKAIEIKEKIEKIECENIDSELYQRFPKSSTENIRNELTSEQELSFSHEDLTTNKEYSKMEEEPKLKSKYTHTSIYQMEEKSPSSEGFTHETTSHFIAAKLGVDLDAEKALEIRIQEFQREQTNRIQRYLEESKKNRKVRDFSLHILNGWNSLGSNAREDTTQRSVSEILLAEQSRQTSGGFFIRWNGMGIAINPGSNFLENFHKQGLFIEDINFVIVTQDSPEAHTDIHRIYDLNYQLNKISPELHVINYYLNHKAYQDLSHALKPNFKQERNTVHSLELFLDSPDIEREKLSDGILLSYFSACSRGGYISNSDLQDSARATKANCMGIRLDLSPANSTDRSSDSVRIGYVSGTSWSPLLAHHLGYCDILITGFGTTNPSDYGKLNYNETSLGYFGTYTLLEEVKPKLLLCAEFDGREGDIRLEIAKKLRTEFEKAAGPSQHGTTILPADKGLFVELNTQKIECSISKTMLEPRNVVVVKSAETYGKLQYLSPNCIL